jgi:hypothetical protein
MMECLISTLETAINKNYVDKGTSSGDIGLQSDRLVVVEQKIMWSNRRLGYIIAIKNWRDVSPKHNVWAPMISMEFL